MGLAGRFRYFNTEVWFDRQTDRHATWMCSKGHSEFPKK